MMMKRVLSRALAIAMVALAGVAMPVAVHAQEQDQEKPATLVGVDKVRAEPLSQTVPVIGRLVARQAGRVSAEINAPVRAVEVRVGDKVKRGDVLVKLDAETQAAQLDMLRGEMEQAEADLASAGASQTLASQELGRQEKLKGTTAYNRSKFESAQQEMLKANANLSRALALVTTKKASQKILELQIEHAMIRAPYDGVVTEKLTEEGSYVKAGDPVVRLISDHDLDIEAEVPALRMAGLEPGTEVLAVLEDGTRFKAMVRATLPVENPMTRTRPVRFTPEWPDGIARLADAQSVTVHIPLGAAREVVTVHKDAIVKQRGQDVVFIVSDGKAAPRTVTLGVSTGSRIEVVDGLKVGDLAVVRGNERLQPGAAVRVN